jgi:N-acetylmuramoyl-L-alanine amidase
MILRRGSKGQAVRDLQKALGIKVDGDFGVATETAIRAYQQANKLTVDGVAGPRTLSHIMSRKQADFKDSVKEVVDKVKPISTSVPTTDAGDPEEIGVLPVVKEEIPTSKFEEELIMLVAGAQITRVVDTIFLHCTATQPNATITAIQNYWKNTLKWNTPGYHVIITADGSFSYLQDFNRASNGVAGHNSRSINIAYIGGIDRNGKALDTRTSEQKVMMERAIIELTKRFPNARLRGHNEVSNKACPSFNVRVEYKNYIK